MDTQTLGLGSGLSGVLFRRDTDAEGGREGEKGERERDGVTEYHKIKQISYLQT